MHGGYGTARGATRTHSPPIHPGPERHLQHSPGCALSNRRLAWHHHSQKGSAQCGPYSRINYNIGCNPTQTRQEMSAKSICCRGGFTPPFVHRPNEGNDLLGSSRRLSRDKSSWDAWVRRREGWQHAGKPVMKMLPSSIEEGVGGGADCDLILLASGDNHPGARRAIPPHLRRGAFSTTPLLIQEGWRLGGRGGCTPRTVFPQPV